MTEKCTDSNNRTWEIYKDKAGEWRWRRTASSGEVDGASHEGYKNKQDCISNAQSNGMKCTPR